MKLGKISLLGLLMVSIGLGVGFAGLKGSEVLVSSTVWVDDDDPTCGGNSPCFQTIQAAVEGVDDTRSDGGFVYIRTGHYRENVVIKRTVSLMGIGSVSIEPRDPTRPTIVVSNGRESRPIKIINNLGIFGGEVGIEIVDARIEVIAGNRITSLNGLWSRYGSSSLPRTEAGIWIERAVLFPWGIVNNEISHVSSGIAMVQGAGVERIFMNVIQHTGYGIVLQDDAKVRFLSSNTFKHNGNHIRVGNTFKTRDNQIGVTGQVVADIVNNQMLLSETDGIAVMAEMAKWWGGLTIEKNLIANSGMAGIYLSCQSPSFTTPLGGVSTTGDPCPGQQGPSFSIIRNHIVGGRYGVIVVTGQGKILRNRISENASDVFNGAGLLLGRKIQVEISHNSIVNNAVGISYSSIGLVEECQFFSERPPLEGKLTGSNNEIRDNEFGDLCPPDYPWPPGFRK